MQSLAVGCFAKIKLETTHVPLLGHTSIAGARGEGEEKSSTNGICNLLSEMPKRLVIRTHRHAVIKVAWWWGVVYYLVE